MLREWLMLPRVRCAQEARRLGYARAQVGLWSRARRCGGAWLPHHQRVRAFVAGLAAGVPRPRRLWVFGAGLCDDLPLAELAGQFEKIILADICFLPETLRRLRLYANVEARLFDATGLVTAVHDWTGGPLPEPSPGILQQLDQQPPDLVLSLCLLSQLPLLPMEWLENRGADMGARRAFGRGILKAHLESLRQFDCAVGLVSEARRIFRNRAGEAVVSESALLDLTPPPAMQEWTWPLAPIGEIDGQTSLDLRVFATSDLGGPWNGADG